MKPAMLRWRGRRWADPSIRSATLQAGARGAGRVIAETYYEIGNESSMATAERILREAAQDADFQVVGDDREAATR